MKKLYPLGARGFLLWTFMLPVLQPEFLNFRALVDYYNAKIKPYGRPISVPDHRVKSRAPAQLTYTR